MSEIAIIDGGSTNWRGLLELVYMIRYLLRKTPWWLPGAVAIIAAIPVAFLAVEEDGLRLPKPNVGLSQDVTFAAVFVLLFVAGYAFHRVQVIQNQIVDDFSKSCGKDFFVSIFVELDYTRAHVTLSQISAHKERPGARLFWLGFLLLIYLIFQLAIPLFGEPPVRTWAMRPIDSPLTFIAASILGLIIFVIMIGLMSWQIINTSMFFIPTAASLMQMRVLEEPVKYSRLPEFKKIGTLALWLLLLAGSGIFFAIAWSLFVGVDVQFGFGMGLYTIFLFIVFARPLYIIGSAVNEGRNSICKKIDQKLDDLFKGIASGTAAGLSSGSDKHSEVGVFVSVLMAAQAQSTLPLSLSLVVRAASVIATPSITFLISRFKSTVVVLPF